MDPVTGHIFAWPILTDGLKQDHPEWFEDPEEEDPEDEELDEGEEEDPWSDAGGGWQR